MGLFDGVDARKGGLGFLDSPESKALFGEALTTYKLEIAMKALEDIRKKDGPGCDLSPAGPCYGIADEALLKIHSS
jgi:hypothetical protein